MVAPLATAVLQRCVAATGEALLRQARITVGMLRNQTCVAPGQYPRPADDGQIYGSLHRHTGCAHARAPPSCFLDMWRQSLYSTLSRSHCSLHPNEDHDTQKHKIRCCFALRDSPH